MGKQATDISQILKYLNGELDAGAMHQLERRAQDDPFLMEALEGYQNAKSDQQANLGELASRLDGRVSEKKLRIIPLRIISIAASVLLICGAGLWWLKQNPDVTKPPSKTPQTAALVTAPSKTIKQAQTKPPEKAAVAVAAKKPGRQVRPTEIPAAAAETPPPIADIQVAPPSVQADTKIQRAVAKDTTPLNEMIAMGYTVAKKKDTNAHITLKEIAIDTAPRQMLEAKVAGVKIYPKTQSAADLTKLMTQGNLGNIAMNQLTTNPVVQGKTIAPDKDQQIDISSVKAGGTNQVAKPNAKQYFKLNPDTSPTSLAANARNYQARRAGANSNARDSVKAKANAADKSDELSETIATGYTSQPREANAIYITAHPQKGWPAFRKYLKMNAVSPDGATGQVKVSFIVDKFGSITNIKVVKGLSEAANKKAVSLVKDGPEWTGNSNKQPETVSLRIKFGKK